MKEQVSPKDPTRIGRQNGYVRNIPLSNTPPNLSACMPTAIIFRSSWRDQRHSGLIAGRVRDLECGGLIRANYGGILV